MALTALQLKERQHYIGGSDVGAILGFNKYKSALEVYFEKVDGIESSVNNSYTRWGNILEPVVRNEFDEILRKYSKLWVHEEAYTKYHKDYKFLAGNVDGLICRNIKKESSTNSTIHKLQKQDPIEAVLEIKTVSYNGRRQNWGEENHDLECLKHRIGNEQASIGLKGDIGEIPESYYCQCAFYMALYDLPKTYLVAYFGNDMPIKVYKIDRDMEFEKNMLEELINFWENNVLKGIPPKPRTLADIIRLYPNGVPDKTIIATNEICDKSCECQLLKDEIKVAKARREALKGDMKVFMGNAEILLDVAGNKLHKWFRGKSKKFSGKLLKEKRPEIYEAFRVDQDTERFI